MTTQVQEEQAIKNYLRKCFPELPDAPLQKLLQNGVAICKLCNKMGAGIDIKTREQTFFYLANHGAFCRYVKQFGFPEMMLVDSNDLIKDAIPAYAMHNICVILAVLTECSDKLQKMDPKDRDVFTQIFTSGVKMSDIKANIDKFASK